MCNCVCTDIPLPNDMNDSHLSGFEVWIYATLPLLVITICKSLTKEVRMISLVIST